MTRIVLALVLLPILATWSTCSADWPTGSAEVQTRAPRLEGTRARNPIPRRMHHKNEGGSDGSGLCVPTSALVAGQYQGVPGLEGGKTSRFWREAKARPGGYWPDKLVGLIGDTLPGAKFANITDDRANAKLLDKLSREGHVISTQMNTGELYNGQAIHHFVNYAHFDSARNIAAIRDNNDAPGVFRWVTASEAMRRSVDGGTWWVFLWLKTSTSQTYTFFLIVAAAGLVVVRRRAGLDAPAPTAAGG